MVTLWFEHRNFFSHLPHIPKKVCASMSWQWLPSVRCGLLVCLLAGGGSSLVAQERAPSPPAEVGQESSVKPGINKDFLDPNLPVDQWVQRFEIESREVFAGRKEILESLGLKEGTVVADIGCGTGLFLAPFSEAVGSTGKVFAVDISPKFVKHLIDRADKENLKNVDVVLCTDRTTELKANTIDVALVCDTYHHFEYPAQTLKSLYTAMRAGGTLVVVDFNRIEGKSSPWTMGHVRAGKEVFRKEIEDAGFKFEEEVAVEIFKENYLLKFRK